MGLTGKIALSVATLILLGAVMMPFIIIGQYLGGGLDKAVGSGSSAAVSVSNSCVTPVLPRIQDPEAFAQAIDSYIKKLTPNSPLIGLGKDFVAAGTQYGVNPAWVVNIARKESSFGTHIPPGTFNSYGRTATDSQPGIEFKSRRWYKYDSFAQSASGQSEYLKRRYLDKGLNTFDTIVPVYAPPSENDTKGYISQVKGWVGEVVAMAGTSLICEDKGEEDKGENETETR